MKKRKRELQNEISLIDQKRHFSIDDFCVEVEKREYTPGFTVTIKELKWDTELSEDQMEQFIAWYRELTGKKDG